MRPVNSSMIIDLVVLDDVVAVLLEQRVRLQRLVHVMHDRDVLGVVEIACLQQSRGLQQLDHVLVAGFGQRDVARFFVEFVVVFDELRNHGVDGDVHLRQVVGRAGDDKRRARFVDQDGVRLRRRWRRQWPRWLMVVQRVFHVVAQIVEAEFVVGAVGDVGAIGLFALVVVQAMDDAANRQAQEAVDLAHPLRCRAWRDSR